MTDTRSSRRITGIAMVLTFVYAVMALAATGRSFVQIAGRFEQAPVPYLLSAAAAVVYILATIALLLSRSRGWYRTAWFAAPFELAGVVIVGTLSIVLPDEQYELNEVPQNVLRFAARISRASRQLSTLTYRSSPRERNVCAIFRSKLSASRTVTRSSS